MTLLSLDELTHVNAPLQVVAPLFHIVHNCSGGLRCLDIGVVALIVKIVRFANMRLLLKVHIHMQVRTPVLVLLLAHYKSAGLSKALYVVGKLLLTHSTLGIGQKHLLRLKSELCTGWLHGSDLRL